ncbi:acyltransferase family protein [Sphingomonas sp. TX0543]|uniref:acyltransferase family protein n=1 Tax=unclassified Sphingomonas TaxID=196159 RepID=UPI0010F6B664|nr:acyltransferase [Sphingomonas sp. 3P27F8]
MASDAAARPHLRYLDGLRGVAILAVLLVHSGQLIAGLSQPVRDFTFYGVRGVQLFFIVSGLTLTINYAGRPFHAANFAARRFFRIAPMFYLGIVLYLLLSRLTAMQLPTDRATAGDVAATILFVHGWLPSAINTVVPGGWSIAAEAMFYVMFPLLLVASRRPRLMAGMLAGSYVLAVVANVALKRALGDAPGGIEFARQFWLVHAPAFIGGCWLGTLAPQGALARKIAPFVLAISVIALIIDSQLRAYSIVLVPIALLTALVWSAGVIRPRALEGRILPLIGEISFSLYVLQFAVLGALHPLAAGMEARIGANPALVAIYLAALLLAGAGSWLTWQLIEKPVVRATRRVGLGRPMRAPSHARQPNEFDQGNEA